MTIFVEKWSEQRFYRTKIVFLHVQNIIALTNHRVLRLFIYVYRKKQHFTNKNINLYMN